MKRILFVLIALFTISSVFAQTKIKSVPFVNISDAESIVAEYNGLSNVEFKHLTKKSFEDRLTYIQWKYPKLNVPKIKEGVLDTLDVFQVGKDTYIVAEYKVGERKDLTTKLSDIDVLIIKR